MNYRKIRNIVVFGAAAAVLASCSESNNEFDPYENWEARNAVWYRQIADSARTAIAEAKAQYGSDWMSHCDWRMYKTLLKAQDYNSGLLTDSICVRIHTRGAHAGDEAYMPCYSDTVRLNFRGWIMPVTDRLYNNQGVQVDSLVQYVFTETYEGVFDQGTAAPQLMSLGSTIEGYSTALQYMTPGDDWYVYIPQQLAYGAEEKGTIPPYSTLLFRLNLMSVKGRKY